MRSLIPFDYIDRMLPPHHLDTKKPVKLLVFLYAMVLFKIKKDNSNRKIILFLNGAGDRS